MTMGYSPVMIEHLFDEALVWALRRGDERLDWHDVQQAKMTEEIGLKQPVEYTDAERRCIATHEAGHATVAHLVGKDRKLEVLSIIKRKDALGLLAHSELEERFTKTRSEILALIQIAMGGMVRRGAVLRRGRHRAGRRPPGRHHGGGPDGRVARHGRVADLLRRGGHPGRAPTSWPRCWPPMPAGRRWSASSTTPRPPPAGLLETNRHLVEALRDALLDREELVGDEILDVLRDAEDAATVIDLRGTAVTDFIPEGR